MYGISKKSNYICFLSFLIVTVNISFFWKITSCCGIKVYICKFVHLYICTFTPSGFKLLLLIKFELQLLQTLIWSFQKMIALCFIMSCRDDKLNVR